MAKQITFSFGGFNYTLEYTRRTVKEMEDEGFRVSEVDERPATMIPMLFAGAFKAHHRFTKQETIEKIYAALPNKVNLISELAKMYNEPIASLMDEPDETTGNVEWTMTE